MKKILFRIYPGIIIFFLILLSNSTDIPKIILVVILGVLIGLPYFIGKFKNSDRK